MNKRGDYSRKQRFWQEVKDGGKKKWGEGVGGGEAKGVGGGGDGTQRVEGVGEGREGRRGGGNEVMEMSWGGRRT